MRTPLIDCQIIIDECVLALAASATEVRISKKGKIKIEREAGFVKKKM